MTSANHQVEEKKSSIGPSTTQQVPASPKEKWTRAHIIAAASFALSVIALIAGYYYFRSNSSTRLKEDESYLEITDIGIARLELENSIVVNYFIENNGNNRVKLTKLDLGWCVATKDIVKPWEKYNNKKNQNISPIYLSKGRPRAGRMDGRDPIDYIVRNSVKAGTMDLYFFGEFYYTDLISNQDKVHHFIIDVNPDSTFRYVENENNNLE